MDRCLLGVNSSPPYTTNSLKPADNQCLKIWLKIKVLDIFFFFLLDNKKTKPLELKGAVELGRQMKLKLDMFEIGWFCLTQNKIPTLTFHALF